MSGLCAFLRLPRSIATVTRWRRAESFRRKASYNQPDKRRRKKSATNNKFVLFVITSRKTGIKRAARARAMSDRPHAMSTGTTTDFVGRHDMRPKLPNPETTKRNLSNHVRKLEKRNLFGTTWDFHFLVDYTLTKTKPKYTRFNKAAFKVSIRISVV